MNSGALVECVPNFSEGRRPERVQSIADRRWTLIHMMYPRADHWSRARKLRLSVTAQQPLQFSLAGGFQHYIGPERARDIEPLRGY